MLLTLIKSIDLTQIWTDSWLYSKIKNISFLMRYRPRHAVVISLEEKPYLHMIC